MSNPHQLDCYGTTDRNATTFMDLNDDCIHEILAMECLSAMDLCTVVETSPRLQEIASRVFRRKHAICNINFLANSEVDAAEKLLMNFGSMMSGLMIFGSEFNNEGIGILDSIVEYCSNTLESLCLGEFVVPDNLTAKLGLLFSNLQHLSLLCCTFEGSTKELFAACGSLVELVFVVDGYTFVFENTFPKLQKFKFNFREPDEINLDSFILRHKNLTSIAIWNYFKMSLLLPIIGDNCKRLEELEFDITGTKTVDLSRLGHLRKLRINCDDLKAVQGWNSLQLLENLSLQWATVDAEVIQTLSLLKSLKVLQLWFCDGLENWNRIGDLNQLTELEIFTQSDLVNLDIIRLIKRLSNLKALCVEGKGFKMDSEMYLRIVHVVRARPDKSKLTFKLNIEQLHDADTFHNFSRNAHIVEVEML